MAPASEAMRRRRIVCAGIGGRQMVCAGIGGRRMGCAVIGGRRMVRDGTIEIALGGLKIYADSY